MAPPHASFPSSRRPPTLPAVPGRVDAATRGGDPPPGKVVERRERVAVAVLALGLLVLVLVQAWGRLVPETKLALVEDPGRFLASALHAWNPAADLGGLQNQAAGYLFPMGPFYWAGKAVGIPMWLVQRLWIGGLLVVAFTGTHRLLWHLRVRGAVARLIGALAYALAPALIGLVAFQSGGQLPTALLPWTLVPLAGPVAQRSPRRAAALSGLAIVAMGGINGASTLAVLVAPALWIATRPAGRARRRLAAWWGGALVAAVTWWVAPLAVYSRFGFDYTPFTEQAGLTTAPESGAQILRGTGNWLFSLYVAGRPWLPGGWNLVRVPVAVAGTTVVAAAGLAGLCGRGTPERRWATLTFLVGAVAVGSGYHGNLGGLLWSPTHSLLDGPFVALRNVAKFQPLVTLPLALGLAATVGWLVPRATRVAAPARRAASAAGAAAAAAAVVVAVLPALGGKLTAPGSFAGIPAYWQETAHWLDAHADGTAALLEPGSAFGEYTWGRPLDEPLGTLTKVPVVVRDQVPLGSAGATDLLDVIDRLVATGGEPQALTPLLTRAGIGFVVVRNDLDLGRTGATPPLQVQAALRAAPGLSLAASFGPNVAAGSDPAVLPVSVGPAAPATIPAVQIYRVARAAQVASYALPATVMSGDADGLVSLADAGLLDDRPVVFAGDAAPLTGGADPWVLTDTNRRRDVSFGDIRDNVSYTLTAGELAPDTGKEPVAELAVPGEHHQTVAVLQGAAALSASSYDTAPDRSPSTQPFAAFDGDPGSAWVPGGGSALGQWLQITFDRAVPVPSLLITPSGEGAAGRVDQVVVRTDGQTVPVVAGPDGAIAVHLDGAPTTKLRITIEGVSPGASAAPGPGLAEVRIDGVTLHRPLATPDDAPAATGGRAPAAILLQRATGDPAKLGSGDEDAVLDRLVTLPATAAYRVTGTVLPVAGPSLDQLLQGLGGPLAAGQLAVTASSSWQDLPRAGPAEAIDGDLATSWVSAPDDQQPSLSFQWLGPRTLDEVRIIPAGPTFPLPGLVEIETPGGSQTVPVSAGIGPATLHFTPVTTTQITLRFVTPQPGGGAVVPLRSQGAGVSEVAFPGLAGLRPRLLDPATAFDLGCGQGPPVTVEGRTVDTAVHGTVGDLLDLRPLALTACGRTTTLAAGRDRITAGASVPLRVTSLVLLRSAPPPSAALDAPAGAPRSVDVTSWGTGDRTVRVGAGSAAVLATGENFNAGWQATLGGARLTPVRLDGWRQAWLVPSGAGGAVRLHYGPDRWQAAGLALGALLVLLLLAAGVLPVRSGAVAAMPVPASGGWWSRHAPAGRIIAVAGVALVGVLLGGPLALLLLPLLVIPEPSDTLPVLAAVAMLAAGAVVLGDPAAIAASGVGAYSAAAQVFAVLAILTVGVAAVRVRE